MSSHIRRAAGLPASLRQELVSARNNRAWSQVELGKRVGLPQVHISAIETGKVVPRFNTLLDLVRSLDHDMLLVPRSLVPIVQALIRDARPGEVATDEGERPLYASSGERDEGDES